VVRVEHIADAPIEALDHAIGFWRSWPGQAVLDAKLLAQQVKLVASAGVALTRGKQAVSKLCPVVGQDLLDLDGAGRMQRLQETARACGCLVLLDRREYPPRGAVDGHEEVTPPGLISHLRQVFDVHVQVTWLVGFERLVSLFGDDWFERIQVPDAVATQAAMESRARDIFAYKFAGNGEQVIQRQEQRFAKLHDDGFLRWCQRGLKSMRGVRAVVYRVARFPFIDGGERDTKASG